MKIHVEPDFSRNEQIAGLIEQISAYIEQYHHGTVQLVGIEDDTVKVRLGGACEGCHLSEHTLKGWVAGTIRQFFPEVSIESVS